MYRGWCRGVMDKSSRCSGALLHRCGSSPPRAGATLPSWRPPKLWVSLSRYPGRYLTTVGKVLRSSTTSTSSGMYLEAQWHPRVQGGVCSAMHTMQSAVPCLLGLWVLFAVRLKQMCPLTHASYFMPGYVAPGIAMTSNL